MAMQVQDASVFTGDLVLSLVGTLLSGHHSVAHPNVLALFSESRHGTLESSIAEMA